MFCARLTFNCVHSTAEESIKETCEIYEKPTCIILGAISACPRLWVLGLFNNTGVSVRLLRFACARANVISFLPPSCRTVSSLWWSLWMAAILCSTSRSPGSLKSLEPVSTLPRSLQLSCSCTAKASSTGLNQGAVKVSVLTRCFVFEWVLKRYFKVCNVFMLFKSYSANILDILYCFKMLALVSRQWMKIGKLQWKHYPAQMFQLFPCFGENNLWIAC